MKSSSINFAPGGLWRFLPFEEEGKTVVVTDVDRLNELESDLTRTRTMVQAGVGAWRVPVPIDLSNDRKVSYLPFMGCQFGIQGGLLEVSELLDAFTWHALKDHLDPSVIYPDCGPLPIQSHKWPSYGFDEYFMNVAAYPRLAQEGMLTFVPSGAKSLLLTLDVEYCTWGNPNSELVYFSTGSCCGGEGLQIVEHESPANEEMIEVPVHEPEDEELAPEPTIGFLFLSREDVNQPAIWREYFAESGIHGRIFAHVKEHVELGEDSFLGRHLIAEQVETDWAEISLVRATLALLKAGLADPACTHFALLSESCVPVRPFAQLSDSLRLDPRSRLSFQPWSEVRHTNILKAQRVEKMADIRKEVAHFQAQWMLLSREDTETILRDDLTEQFEETFAPDECYFATVLALKGKPPRQAVANRRMTWTEHQMGQPNAEEFSKVCRRTVAEIAESGCFFARKFAPQSNIGDFGLHLLAKKERERSEQLAVVG